MKARTDQATGWTCGQSSIGDGGSPGPLSSGLSSLKYLKEGPSDNLLMVKLFGD